MKIAVDMDSVIVELVPKLADFYNEQYKTNIPYEHYTEYNLSKIWGCTTKEVINKVFEFYDSPHFLSVVPLAGATEGIKYLKQRHELYVITSRPHSVEPITLSWIKKYFPDTFSSIHHTNQVSHEGSNHKKKSEVCKEIGANVIFEDCIEFAEDCNNYNVKAFLIEMPWNKGREISPNITRAKDWTELIEKFDEHYTLSR